MQCNPYLLFNGNCEPAFKFYEKVLGGKIIGMMKFSETPAADMHGAGLPRQDRACAPDHRQQRADGVGRAAGALPSR